jgi:hypothetical protein
MRLNWRKPAISPVMLLGDASRVAILGSLLQDG